jgi:3-carboxy-cis,cis-muconate cycloisomerase
MPHKRNPSRSVSILAAVRRAHSQAPLLTSAMLQEHERAAGAWQAEWETAGDLFELTAAAVSNLAKMLSSLEVDETAMLRHLEASGLGGAEDLAPAEAFIDAALGIHRAASSAASGS